MLTSVNKRWSSKVADDTAGEKIDPRAQGDKHRDAKQWSEAAKSYSEYLYSHQDDYGIWIQAGNCFKEAGEFSDSLSAYKKAEELRPKDFEVHLQLGHLYKITGQLSSALQSYETAAALNPDFGEIKHEIQGVLERMKSFDGQGIGANGRPFPSIKSLLAFLKFQSKEDDIFTKYFHSVSGR